jgi:hypothetical protein
MVGLFSETIMTESISTKHIKKITDKIRRSKNGRVIVDASGFPVRKEGVEAIVTLFTRTCDNGKDVTFKISEDMYKVFNYSGMTNIINFTVP